MESKQILKDIGHRMASARKKAGYTQEQLSGMTDLSIKMISAAENGHKAMRPENIMKICECLLISTDFLLKGEVTEINTIAGTKRIANLTSKQKEALMNIVNDFLGAFDDDGQG